MKKKDYLKPQIVVVETEACLLSTTSTLSVSNKKINNSDDLKNEGLTLDSEGILWGGGVASTILYYL